MSNRLAARASRWHEVVGVSDDALAAQIRADRIDILFDLAGHTADHRLLVFTRRPAPIQITWMGYVGTTGVKEMDYLLADRFHVPPAAEVHYCEQILRMPHGYVCYDPPPIAPSVGPLPALGRGFVTFGSFNNAAKLTSEVLALWAEIVRRVPRSRLLLASPALGGATARERIGSAFEAAGGDRERLELRGGLAWPDLLAAYNTVDVALDPFPYSGGITTCEALWMGVPVVTCPGETFASRHSLSHLSNVGLTETVAGDRREYGDAAVRLAGDLPHLASIRAGLRDRMAASPLCDGDRFARDLLSILRDVWRQWCRK
jgi:predicted O-linked N-acetylglucosamine transferase (SPINDLY family)